MKVVLNVAGVVAVLMGTVWFLQGINVLPGSFMTGRIEWAVYGAVAIALGLLILRRARSRVRV